MFKNSIKPKKYYDKKKIKMAYTRLKKESRSANLKYKKLKRQKGDINEIMLDMDCKLEEF